MVYAKFGGQTECIMGNWKIENANDDLACSAGVFFERAICSRKLPEERRKWGESKGAGRGRSPSHRP